MLSCLRTDIVASVLTTHTLKPVLSCHGLQPPKPLASQWRVIRQANGRIYLGRLTQHRKLCHRVNASIALQGAPGILIGLGAFLAGVALAAFLLAAIPTLVSIRRAARAMETTLCTVERELPETAAALRLSSMELSDAIEEVTLLGNDLSQGVRSSAAAVTAAEQGIRQGAQYLNLAVKEGVMPSVRSKVPAAKGAVETQLQQTAKLQHTDPAIQQLARSTRTVTSRLRFGLGLVNAMGRAAVAKQLLQQRPAS
ncbi:hypothetical protein ABBQ32_009496 [Trebouxia sp. C0010 RCD-2024]